MARVFRSLHALGRLAYSQQSHHGSIVAIKFGSSFLQPNQTAPSIPEVSHLWRSFANTRSPYDNEVDRINEKFAEAREEIECAKEDAESVYFNESVETAKQAVEDVLESWRALLSSVDKEDQGKLQRSMGLKIEQLKAELKQLEELHL